MKKRIISCILFFILLFSNIFTVCAQEKNESMIKVTEEVVEEIALNWAESMNPELDLSVGNIVELYDNTNTILGFSIGYFLENTPYGYAIIDFSGPTYIGEYLIRENVEDMYTQIINKSEMVTYNMESPKLTVDFPFGYAVVTGDKIITMNGEEKDRDTFMATQEKVEMKARSANGVRSSGGDIFIDELPSGYHRVTSNSYPDFIGANQSDFETLTDSYACVPVALSIVARLAYLEFDLITAYEHLWNYTDTQIYKVENGISYGSTRESKGAPGFCKYAKEQCGTSVGYTSAKGVSFATIKQIIDLGDLSFFSYTPSGGGLGHAIVPQGYIIASDNHGVASENFVLIADGWNDMERYLYYGSGKFSDTYIARFTGISPF